MRLVLAMVVAVVPILAQAPASVVADGVVTGQVVDGVSGRPVSAAMVSIGGSMAPRRDTSGTGSPLPVVTGSDGKFAFHGLAAGSFTITATKGNYAEGAAGRRRPGGASQPVVLTAGQPSADVTIQIWKNGAITGTVIDEAGEPVVGLQVRAFTRSMATGRRQFVPAGGAATTDDRGVYRFSNLLTGDYIVVASPPAVSVKTSVFQDVARAGRAAGELAAAFAGAAMTSLPVGDATLALPRGGAVPPPPVAGRLQIYPPTFHPSAASTAQASVVPLGIGEERASIDIQLLPLPTARVSGTLFSSTGPADMVPVRLVPAAVDDIPADALGPVSITDSSGSFAFAAVVPGQYVLRSTRPVGAGGTTTPTSWVEVPLTVAGDDIDGLIATLAPTPAIRSRVQYEGSSPRPPDPPSGRFVALPFSLEAIGSPPGSAGVGAALGPQGPTVFGYPPGRYRVRVNNSPQGWMFKSAMLDGVDVSETPFDLTRDIDDLVITFTDRWTGLSGSVEGAAADGAVVLAFTTDSQGWANAGVNPRRLKSARVTAARRFGISSLPPGDYFVVAVAEEDAADWRDPAVLEVLARIATQVSIVEGEHKALDLRVREVRR